jgi:hypothetical protein
MHDACATHHPIYVSSCFDGHPFAEMQSHASHSMCDERDVDGDGGDDDFHMSPREGIAQAELTVLYSDVHFT